MTSGLPTRRGTQTADLGPFEFDAGVTLPLTVAYQTYGEFQNDGAVLICHALTGSHHVADTGDRHDPGAGEEIPTSGQADAWWDDVVGPGKPIDTTRYFVVCANVPGSCYGTTGPASIDPDTGEPYGSTFPPVTVADWTRAQARLLDHLGIDRLRAVTGGSVGGMNVLDWARRFPDRVERIAPIATAPRLGPQLLALHATARRAITGDPHWQGGDYYGAGPDPDHGLALARRIGHITYLSAASMERRFGRAPLGGDPPGDETIAMPDTQPEWAPDPDEDPTHGHDSFPYREVASYLDYNAQGFTDRFDANSYLRLLRAMDEYDLAENEESDRAALAGFDGEALVVSFTGDWHFPVARSRSLVETLRAAGVETTHDVVNSEYGHDAFLVEPETFARPLARFLAGRDPAASIPSRTAPVHTSLFR